MLLVVLNTTIFMAVAALHIYWALGGKAALGGALPMMSNSDEPVFRPGVVATLIVALGLVFFALITVGSTGCFDAFVGREYIKYGNWAIAAIFLIRAVGDFRYVGFTKRVRGTTFADNDTKYYAPLCVVVGLCSLMIAANTA